MQRVQPVEDRSLAQLAMRPRPRGGSGMPAAAAVTMSGGTARIDSRLGRPLRAQQQIEQPGQRGAQLAALHHHVEHAVLQQIFGALEAFRQLLADRLLDDAGAGEADQRARLGDLDVAQHGEAGGDAAGGRIGQHHDDRAARLPSPCATAMMVRGICIRLTAPSCMRAPPEAVKTISGLVLQHGEPGGGDQRLADAGAHRAAHEARTSNARRPPRVALDGAMGDHDGIRLAGLGLGFAQAFAVAACWSRKRSGSAGPFGSSIRCQRPRRAV